MVFLTAGVHFLHYALYGEPLLSLHYFLIAYVWLMIVGGARLPVDARRRKWRPNIPGPTKAPD